MMNAENIEYRLAVPEDAEQLRRLVEACYGQTYPYDLYYQPSLLKEKLAEGLLVVAVAATQEGRIIGQVATLWSHREDYTAHGMAGMIREEYQRKGVLGKMTRVLAGYLFKSGVRGLQLFGVTTHEITQNRALDNGAIVVGFLIPEFPPTVSAAGIEHEALEESNPALAAYYSFAPLPERRCFICSSYYNMVSRIYQQLDSPRELIQAVDARPIGPTTFSLGTNKRLRQLCLQHIGEDWLTCTAAFRKRASADIKTGSYIDIPLTDSCAIQVCNTLREEGWYFGCILMETRGTDYLRMQYSTASINPENIHVATEFGREMMQYVIRDRQRNGSDLER